MTGRPRRIDQNQQRIAVAIIKNLVYLLGVAAGGSLVPQFLAAAAPEPGLAPFQRQAQAFLVDPGHHQNLAAGSVLDNGRNKTNIVPF